IRIDPVIELMQAQLAATQELLETLQKTQGIPALKAKTAPVEKTVIAQQPKLAQALTWLAAYPDRQGLSLRKAAESAGVSTATLRKAIAEQSKETRQLPLL